MPANEDDPAPARLLVGMQKLPHDQLREWLSDEAEKAPDNKTLANLKKEAAREFRKQLTIGYPTDADEAGLKRLVKQLKEGRLKVKLFLRHSLHAKLYLAHRQDTSSDHRLPRKQQSHHAGLERPGELNVDVLERDPTEETLPLVRRPLGRSPLPRHQTNLIADASKRAGPPNACCRRTTSISKSPGTFLRTPATASRNSVCLHDDPPRA
jgi:hypothetical protein